MSLIFTHYDRTHACNHEGMLGRTLPDGTRTCVRCGKTIQPDSNAAANTETFTEPVSRMAGRRPTRMVR